MDDTSSNTDVNNNIPNAQTSPEIINRLLHQVEFLTQQLQILGQQPSPTSSYVRDREPYREFQPDEDLLELVPAMSGQHFFVQPENEADENLDPMDNKYPKNLSQPYDAPAVSTQSWPNNAGNDIKVDKLLAGYQEKLAALTRPVDDFFLQVLDNGSWDDNQREFAREFTQRMRSQIAHLARDIGEDRMDRFAQAKGLTKSTRKDKPVLMSSATFQERVKETQSANTANKFSNQNTRGGAKGRSYYSRNGRPFYSYQPQLNQ